MLQSSVLLRAFRGFVCNRYSDTFLNLFSEKGKDKLYDKSAVLHVRWQQFVYLVLASHDECEIAKEMPSQGKDVVCSEIVIKKIEDLEKKNMSCFETKCRQRKSFCA